MDALDLSLDAPRHTNEQRDEHCEENDEERLEDSAYPKLQCACGACYRLVGLGDQGGTHVRVRPHRRVCLQRFAVRLGGSGARSRHPAQDRPRCSFGSELAGGDRSDRPVVGRVRNEPVAAHEREPDDVFREDVRA